MGKTKAAKTKTSKSKKTLKTKKTVEAKSVSATTSTTTPSVSVSSTTTTVTDTTVTSTVPAVPTVASVDFSTVNQTLVTLTSMLKTLKTQVKTLEKQTTKVTKELQKTKAKSMKKASKRAPSGFAKPAPISKELCKFLNKPLDTEIARTEVTKHLTAYIKEHSLQNPKNKKQIKPDSALSKLLGKLQPEDKKNGYTYFNLQKYMKHHFPKSAKSTKVSQAQ